MGNDLLITATGSPTRQVRRASHVFVHSQFNLVTLINDIAVIRIEPPFILNNTFFRPTTVSTSSPADLTVCNVAGWGAVKEVISILTLKQRLKTNLKHRTARQLLA